MESPFQCPGYLVDKRTGMDVHARVIMAGGDDGHIVQDGLTHQDAMTGHSSTCSSVRHHANGDHLQL